MLKCKNRNYSGMERENIRLLDRIRSVHIQFHGNLYLLLQNQKEKRGATILVCELRHGERNRCYHLANAINGIDSHTHSTVAYVLLNLRYKTTRFLFRHTHTHTDKRTSIQRMTIEKGLSPIGAPFFFVRLIDAELFLSKVPSIAQTSRTH